MIRVETEKGFRSLNSVQEISKIEGVGVSDGATMRYLYELSQLDTKGIFVGVEATLNISGIKFPVTLYPKNDGAVRKVWKVSSASAASAEFVVTSEHQAFFRDFAVVLHTEGREVPEIKKAAGILQKVKEDFYVGLVEDLYESNKEKNLQIEREVLAPKNLSFVCFNPCRYMEDEDKAVWEDHAHIQREDASASEYYRFLSQEEVREVFSYMGEEEKSEEFKEAISLSQNFGIEKKLRMPKFNLPEFEASDRLRAYVEKRYAKEFEGAEAHRKEAAVYMAMLASEKLRGYPEEKQSEAKERMLREMDVIVRKGFVDYFLIVRDIMVQGHQSGDYLLGEGRGSVCGSFLAYLLDIHNIDSIYYDLSFERFLNEHRNDLPDIDIDVSTKTREKLIAYIIERYGAEYVAPIATSTNFGIGSLGKMFESYELPTYLQNKLNKSARKYDTWEEVENGEKALLSESMDARLFLRSAMKLKKKPKNASVHAAGLIISPTKLKEEMPMDVSAHKNNVTQFLNNNGELEEYGFVKYDVLGLGSLDILKEAKELAGLPVQNGSLPKEDAKALALLNQGNTHGIFQMESPGMQKTARDVGIASFQDLMTVVAMYRPGPMENIPVLVDRKNKSTAMVDGDGKEVEGVEDILPILEKTHGIIVFQEQISEIAKVWSGYEPAEAETFRSAVSKKKTEVLEQEEAKFLSGAKALGRDEKVTKRLYDLIFKFANYGYNMSHTVVYSRLTMEMAYLKAHHPQAFYLAVLNNKDKKGIPAVIDDARKNGINVLPPSLLHSSTEFAAEGEAIRCPLHLVTGVGQEFANKVANLQDKSLEGLKAFVAEKGSDSLKQALYEVGALDGVISEEEAKAMLFKGKAPVRTPERELELMKVRFSQIIGEEKVQAAKAEGLTPAVITAVKTAVTKNKKEYGRFVLEGADGEKMHRMMFAPFYKKDVFRKGQIVGIESKDNKMTQCKPL